MQPVIASLVDRAADRFDAATALIATNASLTFKALQQRVARFAGGLLALGVARGDRVAIHLINGWEWIVAYHAVARIGAVVVPANILLSASEVGYIVADSEASLLIAPLERATSLQHAVAANGRCIPLVTTGGDGSGTIAFERVGAGEPASAVAVDPDDLFTIGYTSGTTGKPKGAMLTHRCVFMSTALSATVHVRHSGDRVVSALPLPHVYGNVVMNASLLSGATLVLMERFTAAGAFETIARHRATLFEGVPTMYYQMLAEFDGGLPDISSLTRCTVGGQTMPTANIEMVEKAFGCPLLELWGMTEVAGPAISHSPYVPARHGSIGLPFPQMEARICDADDPGRLLGPGAIGELAVRGPLVMRGYWRNEAATGEAVTRDGWLLTGDVGYQDEDGYLFIVDRKKDVIITAGYNVYPAELEQVLAMHPAVAMAAVAPVADAEKGELAKAFIVVKGGQVADETDIVAHCRRHLAAYKVPRLVEFVEDLPKTSTGKIMRRALRGQR